MVRNILDRPAVNGKVTWNRRKTVSIVENGIVKKVRPMGKDAIVVDGLHEAIIDDETWEKAQIRRKNNHRSKPISDIKNPLSGIIKCKICGRNMIRRPYNNGTAETLMCPLSGCKNVSSELTLVEKKLLNELDKQLDKVYNLFENGIYDEEEFSKRRYELKEDIKNKKQYIKELKEKEIEELQAFIDRQK